jgi:protein ImuB
MCVWCPLWPVQRLLSVQPELKGHPLILFHEFRQHLSVAACSAEARPFRIHVGMPLGEARSLLPTSPSPRSSAKRQAGLKPVFKRTNPELDRAKLQSLALHCQQYSPLVGLEEAATPESLWLDISGNEALFGGEEELAKAIQTDLAGQGIQARIAIADTWGAAWAVSHFAESDLSLVPAGEQAKSLARLPVRSLRLTDAVVDSLRFLEVTTVERLMKLPRTSLPSRLGKELLRRLDQALGRAPELLTAERLIEPIREEWGFEEPLQDRQLLKHVCGVLFERLLKTMETRRAALREVTCYWLGTTIPPFSLRMLSPTTDLRHLLELLELQSERCVFPSGVSGVRLEVIEMGLPPLRQATLFDEDPDETDQRSLDELVNRLSSRLGNQAVLRPVHQPDPLPELSYQWVPWLNARVPETGRNGVASRLRCRPLRLLRVPERLQVEQTSPEGFPSRIGRIRVVRIGGPERIESGWWRQEDSRRDYYRVGLANGTDLWAFHDLNRGQWFLHGLF